MAAITVVLDSQYPNVQGHNKSKVRDWRKVLLQSD